MPDHPKYRRVQLWLDRLIEKAGEGKPLKFTAIDIANLMSIRRMLEQPQRLRARIRRLTKMARTFAEAAKVLADRVTADEAELVALTATNATLIANQKTPEETAAQQLVIDVTAKVVPEVPAV